MLDETHCQYCSKANAFYVEMLRWVLKKQAYDENLISTRSIWSSAVLTATQLNSPNDDTFLSE